MVTAVSAAKPSACTTIQSGDLIDSAGGTISLGYDQWGYNYQAHIFNGWYDNYSRPTTPATDGDTLIMKWNDAWLSNKDCDEDNKLDRHDGKPTYKDSGAWLTNHQSGTYEGINYQWSVNITANKIDIPWAGTDYFYDVTFIQNDAVLTGILDDPYYIAAGYPNAPATGPINGTINGDDVTFTFQYPLDSPQGLRTYTGTVNSSGNLIGTWKEDGPEGASGDFSITNFATKVYEMCQWNDFVKIIAVRSDDVLNTEDGGLYGEGVWYTPDGIEIGPAIWGEFAVIQEVASDPCGGYDLSNYHSQLRSGLGNWAD